MNTIRPWLARLVAPPLAALFLWVATHLGIPMIDPDLLERTTMVVVDIIIWVLTIFTMLYGAIHRWISRKINPADVAEPTAAGNVKWMGSPHT